MSQITTVDGRRHAPLTLSKSDDKIMDQYESRIQELICKIDHLEQQKSQQGKKRRYLKTNLTNFNGEEDAKLLYLVRVKRRCTFRTIAKMMRKPEIKCHRRYLELTKQVAENDPDAFVWTPEEDEFLKRHVQKHGAKHWNVAAKSLPKWLAKECMRRYEDFIKPSH